MNNKRRITNFSNFQNNSNNNKIMKIRINKLNIPNDNNTLEISNTRINSSLKRFSHNKEISSDKKIYKNGVEEIKINKLNSEYCLKSLKMESTLTVPGTISSSKKKIKNILSSKKMSLKRNKSIYDNNIDDNNDITNEKASQKYYIIFSTEPNKKKIDINSFLFKKNYTNYFTYKRINYQKKRNSKSLKKLTIDYYNAFQCFFCEQIYKENEISQLITCGHKFCNKCGENFYYDLINNGYNNHKFKCPLFKCQKEISYNIIEKLLSSKNFDTLRINQMKDKEDNEITKRNFLFKEKEINIDNKNEYNYSIKKRNELNNDNRNVLEINNLKSDYIFYLKNKTIFKLCPKCGHNSLYRKPSNYFLKCLYCKNKFCKFCTKLLTDNHFDTDNYQRCKIFFRINDYTKKKFHIRFIYQIFLMIAGYLFLMSFFVTKMKYIYKNKYKHKYCIIQRIIIYSIYFLFCIIYLPIIIILIPYFPIITCI